MSSEEMVPVEGVEAVSASPETARIIARRVATGEITAEAVHAILSSTEMVVQSSRRADWSPRLDSVS